MRNLQSITAACQGVCFDQFQATRIGRLKCQGQFILTRFELTLASEFHGCFVRGKGAANQARLGQIDARLALVQQNKGLLLVCNVSKLQELGTHKGAAFRVKA